MLNEEKYTLHHGSKVIVEIPEVRIGKYTKDFGYGFYCTIIDKQAKFKHPTHQISFHTQKALETIKYKDAEEVTRDVRFKKHQI